MRFDAADSVKKDARGFEDLVSEEVVQAFLNAAIDHWQAAFGVPRDMQIYLRVRANGHICWPEGR
jgi:hypothetical protein